MSEFNRIIGYEQEDTRIRRGQVYMATHKGEQKLPFMNRSFISFSFGGKDIEDFNLIATIENNRLDRQGSSEFEDLVDEYNILDGQFYWGTHFKANKITFKLATDGITQQELEDFKYWFAGGKTRELILSEHPNRAILARVESPSQIQLLPFEEPATVMISGNKYKTSTTKYKGEITLTFSMDMPFWYSKINIFGYYDTATNTYKDVWYDPVTQQEVNILDSYHNLDVMKIVLEDNIPISSMITTSLLLGNNTFAHLNVLEQGHIAEYLDKFVYYYLGSDDEHGTFLCVLIGVIDRIQNYIYAYAGDSIPIYNNNTVANTAIDASDLQWILTGINTHIENPASRLSTSSTLAQINATAQSVFSTMTNDNAPTSTHTPQYITNEDTNKYTKIYNNSQGNLNGLAPEEGAIVAGPHMSENTGVLTLAKDSIVHFYYAGTAPAYPTIEFTLTPKFNSSTYYIESPCNSYATTSYTEQGIAITYNTITIESIGKQEFKFTTPNIYTAYNEVIKIFSTLNSRTGEAWEVIRALIRDNVKHHAVRDWASRVIDTFNTTIIGSNVQTNALNKMQLLFKATDESILSSTYVFNSETGKAIGTFSYRQYDAAGSGTPSYTIVRDIEEDVGDMIRSKYLIITDRNHPNSEGRIVARTLDSDYTKSYTHILYHNVENGLENIYIRYKNMYL